MKNRMAWVLGGGAAVGMAMIAASLGACSSGDSTTKDAGKDVTTTTDAGKDTGTTADTGTQDTGTTADCGSIPKLHPVEAGTIFCGYTDAGGLNCTTGEQCCLGGKTGTNTYAPEQCATWGGPCDNPPPDGGTVIECGQNADCTVNGMDGGVCCLKGAGAPALVSGCTYYKSAGGTAISCEAPTNGACAAGETQICEQDSDCPQGKTCTPVKWKLYQLGFCN